MNNSISSRWTKIALTGLLLITIAVISSAGTYFYMIRAHQDEATEETTEKEKTAEDISAEAIEFLTITDNLKRQAHKAALTPQYPERETAIEAVGQELKGILTSKYASLLNNDTFQGVEFSVIITEFPLRENCFLKRIQYTIKDNESQNPYEESRYFLQYIGKNSFLSDIELSDFREESFQVFENKNECFAFLISSGYESKTYSSSVEFSNYSAKIFIPGDTGFSVEQTEIPLKVAYNHNLQLVQQDETIKVIIPDNFNEPECLFNSSTLTFEMPKGAWESESVDYELPGLLLGLSDPHGKLRTLFIRKEGEKIRADEYAGQIIFLRKNEFFSLKHYIRQDVFYEDELGNEYDYQIGSIDIKKLLCAPLGVDVTIDFEKANDELIWRFSGSTDLPLYVGEEYICYIQKSYLSGGGSFRTSPTEIRFDKLDDLSKFSYTDHMIPDFQEKTLADLIYGKKANDFYQSNISTYGGETNPYIDFKQLAIKRNLGKWSLMLPVMEEYYHPGNGSFSNWVTDFAAFSNDVPAFLASNSEMMEMPGIWSYWDAKDLINFPGNEAYLAQYDYTIGIGSQEAGDYFNESIDVKIPADFDEYIVSICFTDGVPQEELYNQMSKIK